MIVTECKYDPIRDLKPVDENGWLDLASAYVNKTVPSDLVTQETDYNDIDDPDSIAGKPSDVFDALMYDKSVQASKAKEGESTTKTE